MTKEQLIQNIYDSLILLEVGKKENEIDFDTADRITVISLKDQRKYLKKEIADWKKGEYLHSEDVAGNLKLIAALDLIIKHYGG
jgi:hypothetical protein